MTTPKIDSSTPEVLTDTIYLHLRPKAASWSNSLREMNVVKMAKSNEAAVEPGDYIVKLEVAVPREFFDEAMPSARITLESGQVVAVSFDQADDDEEVI